MSHELIRPAEYARRRGVTRAAVSHAIKRCRIPLIDGKLDPLVADTLWAVRTDPEQSRRAMAANLRDRPPPATGQGGIDVVADDDWRRRRERAEAQLAELQLQEREGTLVKKDEVERMARRMASAIVQQLVSIPDRISAEFGVDDDMRRKMRHRLREEIDQVRAEFARAGMMASQ
jgi:hypothetical protein